MINNTDNAFLEIEEGNLYHAQILLRNAALENPCCDTFQNLGAFYAKEGVQLRSGRGRSANRIAKIWLNKALQYKDVKAIHLSLGYIALEEQDLVEASSQFQSAYNLLPHDWNSAYHCSLCCCRTHDYLNMLVWSRKMQSLTSREYTEESNEMLAFALYFAEGDSNELRGMIKESNVLSSWARFILLVLLHEQSAIFLANEVWKFYSLDPGEMAMLFEVLLPTNPEKAKEYLDLQKDRLSDCHDTESRNERNLLDKLFTDTVYRKTYIENWCPDFPIVRENCYVN